MIWPAARKKSTAVFECEACVQVLVPRTNSLELECPGCLARWTAKQIANLHTPAVFSVLATSPAPAPRLHTFVNKVSGGQVCQDCGGVASGVPGAVGLPLPCPGPQPQAAPTPTGPQTPAGTIATVSSSGNTLTRVQYNGHDFELHTPLMAGEYYRCDACNTEINNHPSASFPAASCALIQASRAAPTPTKIAPLAQGPRFHVATHQYSPTTGQCDTVRYAGHDFTYHAPIGTQGTYSCSMCSTAVPDDPSAVFPSDSCAAIQARTQQAAPYVPMLTAIPAPSTYAPGAVMFKAAYASSNPTPPSPPLNWTGTPWDLDDPQQFTDADRAAAEKPTCLDCRRELSSYLDAWHGKDDYWKHHCAPCREKRGIR